jgi:hypothetical protein
VAYLEDMGGYNGQMKKTWTRVADKHTWTIGGGIPAARLAASNGASFVNLCQRRTFKQTIDIQKYNNFVHLNHEPKI